MKIEVFMEELKNALVKRGVPLDAAERHAQKLLQSFEDDDLGEIEAMDSSEEIDALADSLSAILMRKKGSDSAQKAQSMPDERTDKEKTAVIPAAPMSPIPNEVKASLPDESEDEIFKIETSEKASAKGMAVFWCGLFVSMPVWLALLAVIFGGFAVLFGGLIAFIAALVLVMIALIAVGAICSLVGIIYGITQLFSFVAAGIYEIGLGVAVAGAVLLLSVLIYNFAIRFLPFVIKKTAVFFRFVIKKLREAFFAVRRECYKL